MSIEGITLENFSALPKTGINSSTESCQRNSGFHSFLSVDIKQDAATNTAQSKCLILLLKEKEY